MTNEDTIKWLDNLRQDIGKIRHSDLWPYEQAIEEIMELLEEQKTANLYRCQNCGTWVSAENVIRCKNCKNAEPEFDGKMSRCKIRGLRKNDWFCAGGERK